ncbi:WXG100 family type VII secretion target [Actinoplanes sp. URMC 104]|uniref:WXG100 family type VII secretion target n=1 Tax=Actinoplanes sp. URMC 104 TaxID=3423409 RepID=UPI003F1B4B99
MTSPLVAPVHDSTTWSTGLGLVEDAHLITSGIQNQSWVDGTLGGVGASLDMLSLAIDPLGSLVSWGVAWLMEHVQPLKDALDWLAGNADEVAAHAATWKNVAAFTDQARQDYVARLNGEVAGWFGASGDAYREHAGMHASVLEGLASASQGISSAVEGAGLLVGLVRGIVRDLIAQFIGTLAARLPQWLAEAGLTLGLATPVVIGQVSALVATWVNKIQHFVRALLNSLRKLVPMIGKLADTLAGLRNLLARLSRSGPGSTPHRGGGGGGKPHDPLAPKPPEDYEFNMVENPGPLATGDSPPAANFAGGRYDEVELSDDRVFYRGGDSQGSPLGQWFSTEPPAGVAEVRVDTAVKAQWVDARTGEWQGASPVDAVYEVQIPAGTKVYPGPVANQGGIYVGGGHQVFIPQPWKIPGVTVLGSEPLH